MAEIHDMDGNAITVGLQGCETCDEALRAARRIAASRQTPVHLVDDDGEWIVWPAGTVTEYEAVTDAAIAALRSEAAGAGDLAQVAICDRALAGDAEARRECARVIADAAAQAVAS